MRGLDAEQESKISDDPSPPPSKMMPCGHFKNGRNLVVCIDGTSNQFGEKNTNVIELYNLILKEVADNQKTWYNSGIGTYARPSWKSLNFYKKVIAHKIDMAIAWNFERTVQGAYRWLCDNYQPDDTIFLFGFSRGAYQVRTLAAMIEIVGLLYPGNEMQIPFAYELFADSEKDKGTTVIKVGETATPKKQGEPKLSILDRLQRLLFLRQQFSNSAKDTNVPQITMADRFKQAFSRKGVKIHFVGCWDTVSSIGVVRGSHMLPKTNDGMGHVCFFRHALALDERRVKFLPEYACGGSTHKTHQLKDVKISTGGPADESTSPIFPQPPLIVSPDAGNSGRPALKPAVRQQTLEVWFAGTHSDIGGGNVKNVGMDRSRPPLRWMVFEAGAVGLRTAPFERELSRNEQIHIQESLSWVWWPLEVFPLRLLTFSRNEEGRNGITHKPHFGASRKIHPGQMIHSSIVLADNQRLKYTPKAQPPGNHATLWNDLGTSYSEWLEVDLYTHAKDIVHRFLHDEDGDLLGRLASLASSRDGEQAVYDAVLEGLETFQIRSDKTDAKQRLLRSTLKILATSNKEQVHDLKKSMELQPLLSDFLKTPNQIHRATAAEFLASHADPCIRVLHVRSVCSVALSPDGKRIASGSTDAIRLWDATTGAPIGELHTVSVTCVAFSADGKLLASGSGKDVRIWNVETGAQVGQPFDARNVTRVAFSPRPEDNLVIASSTDSTIRLWDVDTGEAVCEPLKGHRDPVYAVAFSPDGRYIVSGSTQRGRDIWLWDVETRSQVGMPFQGHSLMIADIVFSPDGQRIVTGSLDGTALRWDVQKREQIGEALVDSGGPVCAVAISPDAKRIVTGSDTLQVWDMESGRQLGKPFRGHTSSLFAVAFSRDGKRLVSGGSDGTIRIWDAEAVKILAELQVDDDKA